MSSSNASKTIARLYNARKNLLDLLMVQGYDVDGYTNFGVNEVNAMYAHKQLDMLVETKLSSSSSDKSKEKKEEGKSKPKKKAYIKFHLEKMLSTGNIDQCERHRFDGKGYADYCHETGSQNHESVFKSTLSPGSIYCATFIGPTSI